jgi:hypothetical protein
MQDSHAAPGEGRIVDIPPNGAYPQLVTKDTGSMEQLGNSDAEASGDTPTEVAPPPTYEGYYEKRHARFMAAVRGGSLALDEYVQEVVDTAGGRLPQFLATNGTEHQTSH